MKASRRAVIWMSIVVFLFVLPFLPALLASFGGVWRYPALLPDQWNLRAWNVVFSSTNGTLGAILMSIGIAVSVTTINLLVGVPAAYALVRAPIRGKRLVEWLLLLPLFIPALASVMGIHLTFLRFGLTETVLGVVLVHLAPSMPYVIRAAMVSLETLSEETEDAARMLGASGWPRFLYVVLPHILPGISAGAALSLLISLSQYSVTLLIGAGQVVTLPILLFPFLNGGDPAIAAAYTLVFSLLASVVLLMMDQLIRQFYGRRGQRV